MRKSKEMIGLTFGRLRVISKAPNKGRCHRWNCLCECGKTTMSHGGSLRGGDSQSCGCLRTERSAAALTKHSRTDSAEYRAWTDMKTRCYNRKYKDWPHWGGRGITVCAEWLHDFAAFFAHVGERPSSKHSIDRRDNSRGYEPGNVRWATSSEQNRNRRNWRDPSYPSNAPQLLPLP